MFIPFLIIFDHTSDIMAECSLRVYFKAEGMEHWRVGWIKVEEDGTNTCSGCSTLD